MDILMIGHSRSGKTSYMAGLYKQYGDKKDGMGIWASDSSKRARLTKIANNISKGIYPSGTDISSEYNFWLQINDKLIIPFNWYDYRGGALSENSKDSRDAKLLIEKIEKSDALIIFLDGEKIVSDTNEDIEEEYDTILWAVQKAVLNKKKGIVFPISFVITKGDLFPGESPIIIKTDGRYYNSYFKGLRFFYPFIHNICESKWVAGLLCKCEISSHGVVNVFPPLLYSLYYGMKSYINKRIDIHNEEVDYYNSLSPNLLDDVFCGICNLFGDPVKSDRELARKSKEKIDKEKENFTFLESKRDEMWNMISMWHNDNIVYKF